MTWIAEDVPAYEVEKNAKRPTTGEGWGMTAPTILYKGDNEKDARSTLGTYLIKISNFDHVTMFGDPKPYREAATRIATGTDSIRVEYRYYRIRQV